MLRSKPGIVYAEVLAQRDGDAYCYNIESEVGIDIRKSLFYTLAEKNWPLIGMEALGMSLEDIFIAIVDQSAPKARYERKGNRSTRGSRAMSDSEQEIVRSIKKTSDEKQGGEFSALFGTDDGDSDQ